MDPSAHSSEDPKVPDPIGEVDRRYRERAAELEGVEEILAARQRRFSALRMGTFVAAILLWASDSLFPVAPAGKVASLLALVVFAVLVRRHRETRRALLRTRAARDLARQGSARLARRWEDLPDPGPPPRETSAHRYAGDLDLFGRASLLRILGPVHTPMGRERLHGWLLEPSPAGLVPPRQEAVRELANDPEQREEAAVDGALLDGVPPEALASFLSWCGVQEPLPAAVRTLAWLLPLVTLALGIGDILDLVPTAGWLAGLVAQAVLAQRLSARLHAGFSRASSGAPGLRRYHTLLARWEGYPARSSLVRNEVALLNRDHTPASRTLQKLERLLHLSELRFSMLHPVLNIGLFWDVHVHQALERWRRRWGTGVEGWMEALGHLEALSAVATLAADHPHWAFPDMERPGNEPLFRARELGHPLIPPARCVRNDVVLGPPGRVLLITGSNMSGKSTLLRSVGLAVVMARAGGPVCARELHIPQLRLFTSMRVSDSLEEGVSYFMAELLRLKALLDAAPTVEEGEAGAAPLLYLVDEILQGTNSEERRMAGRRLIRHLLGRWAIGAVTTHDLGLHREPRVEAAADLVHFRELVDEEGEGLLFDYRLRPGLATTRNALRLAERVGLTDPDG